MFHKIISIGVSFDLSLVESIQQFRFSVPKTIVFETEIKGIQAVQLGIPADTDFWIVKLSNGQQFATEQEHEADELFDLLKRDPRRHMFDQLAAKLIDNFDRLFPTLSTPTIPPIATPAPRYAGQRGPDSFSVPDEFVEDDSQMATHEFQENNSDLPLGDAGGLCAYQQVIKSVPFYCLREKQHPIHRT